MELDLKRLFSSPGAKAETSGEISLESRDLPGYSLDEPLRVALGASTQGNQLTLEVELWAKVAAECARCLAPVRRDEHVHKVYKLSRQELQGEYPELPLTANGNLDVDELVYGELLIEVSGVLLCREDCPGLCQRCGQPKESCGCAPEPEGDERMQVLRQLLNSPDDSTEPEPEPN